MMGTMQRMTAALDLTEQLDALPRGAERRAEVRRPLAIVVEILPLDEHRRPSGRRRQAVTHSISEGSIGLYADVPATTRYLTLWLPTASGRCIELFVEITRCDEMAFMYSIGGRIVEPA